MNENRPDPDFVDKLVSQDAVVSAFPFEEARSDLERKLESLERRARSIRRASLIASAVSVAWTFLFLPVVAINGGMESKSWVSLVVFEVWGITFWAALITAGVLLSLYQHKYRPALDRARSDLQLSMIADLQRQVAALIQRLNDKIG